MDWIMIGLGAGAGSVFRYEIGRRIGILKSPQNSRNKTTATFVVNMTGAFLLGFFVTLSINGLWWSLLAEGFLGGFTTFSTFMVEGVILIRGNQKMNALVYFLATMVFGIAAFLLGSVIIGWISA